MLSIQLDIFSGRPNPEWTLSKKDLNDLVDRVTAEPSLLLPLDADVGGLGYRGFIVNYDDKGEDDDWKKAKLPKTIRIGKKDDLDKAAASWLLRTSTHVRSEVSDDILTIAQTSVNTAPVAIPLAYTACGTSYYTSDSNFSFWNDAAYVTKNNCYNFASNLRTNTFAQPGRGSGKMFTELSCADIGAAAQRNGWSSTCRTTNNYNVCLVLWPGYDFHWYRLCANGHWCHKPGTTNAKNTDNSGKLITDPTTCDRGSYTVVCSYWRGGELRIN